jgi:hypothetical protein
MIWAALVFTCLAGWPLVRPWLRSGPLVACCLSFTVGAAALSLELLLFNLARLPWNRWLVIAPWVLVWGCYVWRCQTRLELPRVSRPLWIEWPAAVFGLLVLAAWVPYERLMPLNEWDAVMLWMFKARAFYLDGSVGPYLARAHEFLGNPAYPLLIPLYATFLYIWTGGVADHAAKVFSPCFLASLVAGFYHLTRRFSGRAPAAIFTAMLLGVHILNLVAFHYAGYADTAVAACVVLGGGFLYAWQREGEFADFFLAVLFASGAAWTKNEGLLFLAGLGAIAGVWLVWRRERNPKFWATLAGLPALAVGPWAVARSLYGVQRPGQLSGEIVQTNVASYWPTLQALVEHSFAPGVLNLVFPLWIAAVVLHRRAGLDWKFLVLPFLVVWQLFGVTLVYVTGPVNLQWMIGSSLDRVLSQIAPLALLGAGAVAGSWYEEAESRLRLAGKAEEAAKPGVRERRAKGKSRR